jgi:hypothetical protein
MLVSNITAVFLKKLNSLSIFFPCQHTNEYRNTGIGPAQAIGQTQLHPSLNQMALSLQNPLILPTTVMIFSLVRLASLGMTCPQQTLNLHIHA